MARSSIDGRLLTLVLSFFALLTSFSISVAHPQEIIRTHTNIWLGDLSFGRFVLIGDIDGDGFGDLVVGEENLQVGDIPMAGRVAVLSGKTGQFLHTILGEFHFGNLGHGVAGLGDVTEDGIPDFMASAFRPTLHSKVWSGADGSLVAELDSHFDVAEPLGDLNGDGIPDFVSAFRVFMASGKATVTHGGKFNARYSHDSPPETHNFGQSITSLGDVDGDGLIDFAVAAPGDPIDAVCAFGEVFVYSGADGESLWSVADDERDSMFGNELAGPGDLDGDGIGDLVVAAFRWGGPPCVFPGPGQVRFFSGRTGSDLGVFNGPVGWSNLGQELASVGDLNGNGYGDVLIGVRAPLDGDHMNHIVAVDGGTRSQIYFVENPFRGACNGFAVEISAAGDVDDDDFPDFFASSGCFDIGPSDNRIDLLSGAPRGVSSLADACGAATSGKLPRIGVTGVPRRGRALPVHLSRVDPGVRAFLLVGQRLARGVHDDSCLRVVRPFLFKPVTTAQIRPGEGVATVEVKIPADPSVAGATFFVQWVNPDPSGSWAATRVLEIEVQEELLRRTR